MPKSQRGFAYIFLILALGFLVLLAFGIYRLGFYRYYLAERAFANKNYDDAINNYHDLVQRNNYIVKFNPEIYYKLGRTYLLKHKNYLAGANFHKFLQKVKDIKNLDKQKQLVIGVTFAQTGRYYQAIKLLEATLPDKSSRDGVFDKVDYYNYLAESYLDKKKNDLALENVDKALVIENASPASLRKTHAIKFLIYKNVGDSEKVKKETQTLASFGYENLDSFELEFYDDQFLNYVLESGVLQHITDKSIDSVGQKKDLPPIKKASIFTVWAEFQRQNSKFQEAEVYAKKAIDADPDYLPAYYAMGNIYLDQGRFNRALEYDQQASKIDPDHPVVGTRLGWDFYNLSLSQGYDNAYIIEKMNIAEENFQNALEVDPEFAMAHNNLGLVYFERDQCDKALDKFNQSIGYDSTYPKPVNNIGVVYYEAQDYDTALEYFEKSLKIKPGYALAYFNIGRVSYYMGNFQKSLSALQQDLKLDPYDTDAYRFIAKNYLEQGKNQEAINALNKAITLTPDYPKLYFDLSDAYQKSGDVKKDREAYEKAMSFFLISGADYIYHYNRGVGYKRDGKIDQAAESFKKAIKLQPDYTDSYIHLSRIYESQYGKAKSIELLQKGLKAAPESLSLYDELGHIYKDNGDSDNAFKLFTEAIPKIHGNCDKTGVARIYEGLGLVYYDRKQFDEALENFNKALELNQLSKTIYTNLGAAYIAKGDRKKASEYLYLAIQINPNDAVAHNDLGDLLAQDGLIAEAQKEFRKALKIDPNLKIAKENLERYQKK